jgi:hypothetical protein
MSLAVVTCVIEKELFGDAEDRVRTAYRYQF